MNCSPVKVFALTVGVLFYHHGPARADVIHQTPRDDFLVVEAEAFDSLVQAPDVANPDLDGFRVVTTSDPIMVGKFKNLALPPDGNVSGGAALYTTETTSAFMVTTSTWKLQFETPGLYSTYFRYTMYDNRRADNYDNEDSWFLPLDFNEPGDQRFDWNTLGHNDSLEDPPFWEGNFHWQQGLDYEVRPEDVGTVKDFIASTRETGGAVDLFVFSLDPDLAPNGDEDFEQELDDLFVTPPAAGDTLQAGDADQDFDFDQLDLVKVQISAKYLSGQPATWGEGDWDGAPGGSPGNPPAGNSAFDQLDIISALAPGHYLTGPYASLTTGGTQGDEQTSLVYDARTGDLKVDAPASTHLTSINIDSAGANYIGDKPAVLDGSFDNFAAENIFKATFGGSFGDINFGNVLPAGLSEADLATDLSAVGSLAGGGDIGNVDLVYIPEPSVFFLLGPASFSMLYMRRKRFTIRSLSQ